MDKIWNLREQNLFVLPRGPVQVPLVTLLLWYDSQTGVAGVVKLSLFIWLWPWPRSFFLLVPNSKMIKDDNPTMDKLKADMRKVAKTAKNVCGKS